MSGEKQQRIVDCSQDLAKASSNFVDQSSTALLLREVAESAVRQCTRLDNDICIYALDADPSGGLQCSESAGD